ncbi:MAG: hypothetical protein KDB27_35480, partial [Planctomycetales bacterium]|nr:hypothetical protein [Planctomycetales bacterium]
ELARKAFEHAVELDPSDVRAWGALYRFYVAARPNPAKAREVLDRLTTDPDISELDRAFGLAQLRESIDQVELAAEQYDLAISHLNSGADDLSRLVVYERAAQFFREYDFAKAVDCSREALKVSPESIGARETLIDVLVKIGTKESIGEAETLLLEMIANRDPVATERRLHAEILQAKASVQTDDQASLHTQAVATLRAIPRQTTRDMLMTTLSQLSLAKPGTAARQLTMAILAEDVDIPRLIAFLQLNGNLPVEHSEFAAVFEQAFVRIEGFRGYEIESLKLRLQHLHRTAANQSQSDLKNLESLVIDQHAARCLRRLQNEKSRSELCLNILNFLLHTDRVDDAIRLAKLSPPPVSRLRWTTSLAVAFSSNHPLVGTNDEAEQFFEERLMTNSTDAELNFALGNLRLMQRNYDAAISHYERASIADDQHWLTLNNMAIAKCESNPEESLELINRAIEIGGRNPVLLDTLALLQIKNGHHQEAIDAIVETLPSAELTTSGLIHLSAAWLGVGDDQQASSTFALIDDEVVTHEALAPFDREMYAELKHKLTP